MSQVRGVHPTLQVHRSAEGLSEVVYRPLTTGVLTAPTARRVQTGAMQRGGLTLHCAITVKIPHAVVLWHAVLPMHADDPFKGLLGATAAAAGSSAAAGGSSSSSRFLLPPDPLTDASASRAAAFSRQDVLNLLAVLANKVGAHTAGLPCAAAAACHSLPGAVDPSSRPSLSLPPTPRGAPITHKWSLCAFPCLFECRAAGTPIITATCALLHLPQGLAQELRRSAAEELLALAPDPHLLAVMAQQAHLDAVWQLCVPPE